MVGLIPLISAKVHPIAVLFLFNTSTNLLSCSLSNLEDTIAGSVSSSPRYTYFKWSGSGLSSKVGAFSTDGNILVVEAGRPMNGALCRANGTLSKAATVSSTYSSQTASKSSIGTLSPFTLNPTPWEMVTSNLSSINVSK